jgi:hypothetical protein
MNKEAEAGRALDAEIAEKVMGFEVHRAQHITALDDGDHLEVGDYYYYPKPKPSTRCFAVLRYSTDIAAAFQVADKICGDQYDFIFQLKRLTGRKAPGRWWAHFSPCETPGESFDGYGEDAPIAICRAVLKSTEAA